MIVLLFDDSVRSQLLPFTHTRPVADIRCGILTMRERWENIMGAETGTLTEAWLQPAFPAGEGIGEVLLINGAFFADKNLKPQIEALALNSKLISGGRIVAARLAQLPAYDDLDNATSALPEVSADAGLHRLERVWDIFSQAARAIKEDYLLLTEDRLSSPLPAHVSAAGKADIFIEEGAVIAPGVVINATTGPVYIGKGAEIMEGCLIRGPLALCDGATLKMGAKIYGGTVIGPGCKVGGEVSNVIFFANSNKGHDGFLGNAVIGEWCNLGADTNCSNLKNNYNEIKIWDEASNRGVRTGLTFCGLLMGDHSKCGINTMFNTGTIVGVSCNLWGGGFPEKFVPSFTWGGSDGAVTYSFDRAIDTAKRMMQRRHKELTTAESEALRHVFEATEPLRQTFNKMSNE